MSDDDAIKRVQLANKMNLYLMAKGYPSLAGHEAPLTAVTNKGCNSHGILYSCSKCGWNHCMECGSSEVVNSTKGVSGWLGLCKKCLVQMEIQVDAPPNQLSTLRLDPSSAEYQYVVSLIGASIATGGAFYAQAPFATHGMPVQMHHKLGIVEITRARQRSNDSPRRLPPCRRFASRGFTTTGCRRWRSIPSSWAAAATSRTRSH